MSPTRRKTTRRKTARKTGRTKMLRQESILRRAGLVSASRLNDAKRARLAKLTVAEARALVSAKRKLGYRGSLHIRGFFF